MTDELLDLYSASGTPLGRAKPRSAVHRDGDWHKTFHCWMCYRGEAGQEMLILQKRSPHVETWPNRFDITAAGHYRTGEDLSGGVREIAEELGVSVTAAQLIRIMIIALRWPARWPRSGQRAASRFTARNAWRNRTRNFLKTSRV